MKQPPGLPLMDIQMRFRTPGGCPVAQIGVYSFTTSSSDAMPRCILIFLLLAVVSPLQTALADAFTESLTPVRKDCELEPADLAQGNLILPGGPGDNSLADSLARMLAPGIARGLFRWQGAICADPDDGLFIALPNPWNPSRLSSGGW